MRSVDVVLPASMCAMIPMFRVSSSLKTRPMISCVAPLVSVAISASLDSFYYRSKDRPLQLPAIVRKGLVRFRHAVNVFLLLDGAAASIRCVNQLIRELVDHRLARALARILQQPANRQRLPPEWIHFHRNLIVRAANAPRLHFQRGLHVLD